MLLQCVGVVIRLLKKKANIMDFTKILPYINPVEGQPRNAILSFFTSAPTGTLPSDWKILEESAPTDGLPADISSNFRLFVIEASLTSLELWTNEQKVIVVLTPQGRMAKLMG